MFQTADLCDRYDEEIHVVDAPLRPYGGITSFHGRIATVRCRDDNSLVRAALETRAEGRVLVVDGGGSRRCALVGDQLARLAIGNGWVGIVVFGCVRDSRAIEDMAIGVVALGTHPRKSVKRGAGERDVAVEFGGVTFHPDQYLYADDDGVIVSPRPLG